VGSAVSHNPIGIIEGNDVCQRISVGEPNHTDPTRRQVFLAFILNQFQQEVALRLTAGSSDNIYCNVKK
jgi:hypothetical protein